MLVFKVLTNHKSITQLWADWFRLSISIITFNMTEDLTAYQRREDYEIKVIALRCTVIKIFVN